MHDRQRHGLLPIPHHRADFETADVRQVDIQHDGGDITERQIQGFLSGACFDRLEAGRPQGAGSGIASRRVVIDHQHRVLRAVDADIEPG